MSLLDDLESEMIDLAALAMRFGEVERITSHPDGRRETDSTHTVMLMLCAFRIATYEPGLTMAQRGDVLLMALVHDLVEAYAGDVATLAPLSGEAQASKDKAEAEALDLIAARHPWLGHLIRRYERQECRASQFVKLLDKTMPKLVAHHNDCSTIREVGMTLDQLEDRLLSQRDVYARPRGLPLATQIFEKTSESLLELYADASPYEEGA